jgi:hypothetical protein
MHGYLILWYKTFKKCFVRLNAPGMRCKNAFIVVQQRVSFNKKLRYKYLSRRLGASACKLQYINSLLIIIIPNWYFRRALIIESLHNQSPLARKLNYAKRSLNGTSTIQIWWVHERSREIQYSGPLCHHPLLPTSLFLAEPSRGVSIIIILFFSARILLSLSVDLHLHGTGDNGRKVHRADLGANLASQLPLNAALLLWRLLRLWRGLKNLWPEM